jgi:hypothetical protein
MSKSPPNDLDMNRASSALEESGGLPYCLDLKTALALIEKLYFTLPIVAIGFVVVFIGSSCFFFSDVPTPSASSSSKATSSKSAACSLFHAPAVLSIITHHSPRRLTTHSTLTQ